ncbi:Pentapeptide repeat-containing protein [Gammaproteobacteria bacterium]
MTTPDNPSLAWYVRRNQKVAGPYPSGLIRRFVLLGRLRLTDEVSRDGQSWQTLQSTPEALPPGIRGKTAAEQEEFLRLGRLREDERSGQDRRALQESSEKWREQRQKERREAETEEVILHRIALNERLNQKTDAERRQVPWRPVAIVAVMVVGALLFGFRHPNLPLGDVPDCEQPAQPGVNWRNCVKSGIDLIGASLDGADLRNSRLDGAHLAGADLSHALLGYAWLAQADLSQARLKGASLIGAYLAQADLSYADLGGADLSFANLRGARLGAAQLQGARLDMTVWIDGRPCSRGSMGTCLRALPPAIQK